MMRMRVAIRLIAPMALVALLTTMAAAQDAKTVIANASKAMGIEGMNSIHFYGVAQNGNLGQNNNSNQPWPMANMNDYVRAIDFNQPASRATWVTYAVPVTGGAATMGNGQQNITPQNMAWAQQLEIWTTPWGFLKGAAANNATAKTQTVGGKKWQVVTFNSPMKSPGGLPYKVVGYLNAQNLVERVDTWLDNPFFGDMLVESEYTNYRDNNGLKFPATMVQKRAGWPVFEAYILGAHANPSNIQQLLTPPAPQRGAAPPGGAPAGGGRGGAPPAPVAASTKLADGVYQIGQNPATGAYNAMAVEFADHILLFEPGPQSEARALAIIAETKRVIPNKPIRYGVISHHHLDHTSGLAAAVAEGITIVTKDVNRAYIESAMNAPRTLAPDSLSKSGKKLKIETIDGDKRVFQDATRTVEIHLIKGLPHADGLLIAWLPKEKILAYADMFNLPAADQPVPNPPVVGTQVFVANMERLNLDAQKIMSVHTIDPATNRLTSRAEILKSLGR